MKRSVCVEIPIFRVVRRNLNKAVGPLRQDVVGTGLVVELHLNGVVGPAHREVVVFAVVNL